MNNSSPSIVHLLYDLKSTVELLIQFRGDSLQSKYGAVEKLRSPIFAILSHQLKQINNDIYEQLWQIIVRLNANSQRYIHLLQDIYHKENIRLSVEQWIDQSVINQCLSDQLSSMENNDDLLNQYYHRHAFLFLPKFYQAFLICLRTIERSDPLLLMHIEPKLFLVEFQRLSFENNSNDQNFPSSLDSKTSASILIKENCSNDENQRKFHNLAHRRIHSDPIFSLNNEENAVCYASSSDLSDENLSDNRYKKCSSVQTNEMILPTRDEMMISTNSTSPIEVVPNCSNSRLRLPHSSLFWPRKGQTLDNYIRESDLRTRTDVEKENAHLYFSEAILAAIEQIKFTQQCQKQFGQSWSSSITSLISPCETTHISSSPTSSTSSSTQQYIPCNSKFTYYPSNKSSTMKQCEYPTEFIESTTESATPPSTFDLSVRTCSSLEDSSAEAIALTLMETWTNYQVPVATELLWMISHDTDLPQTILPIPDGIPIDPSEDSLTTNEGRKISCRGNDQWAPPREQLIFHVHSSPNRDNQLKEQRYLCAGCGRRVEKSYAYCYRYCEYTDKYFCRSCHSNKRTFLPSYIIMKWEFSTKHYVSNFAFDYLNRIRHDPIFNLYDLNQNLYKKSRKLRLTDDRRWSLYYLQQYILHCRLAEENGDQEILKKLPLHIYRDPYSYSLEDLFRTKSGEWLKVLDLVVIRLREHILNCPICVGQGHICQICRNLRDIIFPFDLETSSVCQVCRSCFHLTCYQNQNNSCPKCPRQKIRRNLTVSNRSATPTNDDIIT